MARKKAGTYGLLELAKDVIQENGNKPLSAQEIWDMANDDQKQRVTTKTGDPVQNIYSIIYNDVKNHEDTELRGVGRNPAKWQLIESDVDNQDENEPDNEDENEVNDINSDSGEKSAPFSERVLHRLLVSYVGNDPYFSSCYCKTIFHEHSKKKQKGMNHWVHPDIVGVSYPFSGKMGGYDEQTLNFMSRLEHTECRLYSFEMKTDIKASNLREWFFEAVSNSSWAHEGYLVALDYEPGIENEMKMLNESFGIGFIKLNVEDYTKSLRLFTAKRKDELDWNMVNRLLSENPDFRSFIKTIQSDMTSASVRNESDFDEQFKSQEEFLAYIEKNHIKSNQ